MQDRYAPLGVVAETAQVGGKVKDTFKSERWLRDAVSAINEKVKNKFDIEKFFDFQSSRVRVIKENFE